MLNTLELHGKALRLLDQTLLPGEIKYIDLTRREDIWQAIYALKVRGAPAIGVAAALGVYVCAAGHEGSDLAGYIMETCDYLSGSRPTAVNLFWALDRMRGVAAAGAGLPREALLEAVQREAISIMVEDMLICEGIGQHGAALIAEGDGLLTHCNAGRLATSGSGTALSPIYHAHSQGKKLHVYMDETRPLLQGARITATELSQAGIGCTLICDNMAADVMSRGRVQAVFVGCDRVAANGDAANKIGTLGVAVLARHFGLPFYVCCPSSTIDLSLPDGAHIEIEQRPAEEVTEMWYAKRMAPQGIKVYNPAFDVTPAALISGIITEHRLIKPPFDAGLAQAVAQSANTANK